MAKTKKMAMGGKAFNMLRNQVSSPGSFNNPSNIGTGNGPRLPTNRPPRDFGTGNNPRLPTNLPPRGGSFNNPSNIGTGNGPRLPTNLPPRDSGTGTGPRLPTNLPPRGGTPAMVKNAPGYRGSGTQPMPSSQPRGFSKGGSASKRADGIAIRGKTRA
jgi:hypothetical protein